MNPPESSAIWAILLIVSPLAAAVISFLARRIAGTAAGVNAAVTLAAALALLDAIGKQPMTHEIGDWGTPLGIALHADALTAVLILATSIIVSAITVSSRLAAVSTSGSASSAVTDGSAGTAS